MVRNTGQWPKAKLKTRSSRGSENAIFLDRLLRVILPVADLTGLEHDGMEYAPSLRSTELNAQCCSSFVAEGQQQSLAEFSHCFK
jgi:hypothetical protein